MTEASAAFNETQNKPVQGALFSAVTRNKVTEAIDIIEQGADINEKDELGNTPLIKAASRNFADMVEMLINAGAEVNCANDIGQTPLLMWAGVGDVETARFVIEHGGDVNKATKAGETPLVWAVRRGHPEMASFLIEKGASPEVNTNDGKTLLAIAKEGKPEIVRIVQRAIEAEQAKRHHAATTGKQERLKNLARQKSNRGVCHDGNR